MHRNIKEDYSELLQAIFLGSEAQSEKSINKFNTEHLKIIKGFYIKFFYHCSTIFNIVDGISLPWISNKFQDIASIQVLARSSFEIFLHLNYIFIESKSEDELELRFTSWKLAGWQEQEEYKTKIPEYKIVYENIKNDNDKLREILRNNPLFDKLTEGEQKVILSKKGKWLIPEKNNKGNRHPPTMFDLAKKGRIE